MLLLDLSSSSSLHSTRFTLTGNVVASVVETFKQIALALGVLTAVLKTIKQFNMTFQELCLGRGQAASTLYAAAETALSSGMLPGMLM